MPYITRAAIVICARIVFSVATMATALMVAGLTPVTSRNTPLSGAAVNHVNSQIVHHGGVRSSLDGFHTRSGSLALHQPFVVFHQTRNDELQDSEAE